MAPVSSPRLARAQEGVVYAEFIIAFTPFFLLFLGIIQLAFIAAGGVVVQTAAVKAARAATVIIPDDRYFYDGEKEMVLNFAASSDDSKYTSGLEGALQSQGGVERPAGAESGGATGEGGGGARLAAIRMAASIPLAILAPDPALLLSWLPSGLGIEKWTGAMGRDRYSLRHTAIGESPVLRFFAGFLLYNSMAAAINFPKQPGGRELYNAGEGFQGSVDFSKIPDYDKKLTVRITYLYACSVPIVNLIVCRKINPGSIWGTLSGGGLSDDALEACGDTCSDALETGKQYWSDAKGVVDQGAQVVSEGKKKLEELEQTYTETKSKISEAYAEAKDEVDQAYKDARNQLDRAYRDAKAEAERNNAGAAARDAVAEVERQYQAGKDALAEKQRQGLEDVERKRKSSEQAAESALAAGKGAIEDVGSEVERQAKDFEQAGNRQRDGVRNQLPGGLPQAPGSGQLPKLPDALPKLPGGLGGKSFELDLPPKADKLAPSKTKGDWGEPLAPKAPSGLFSATKDVDDAAPAPPEVVNGSSQRLERAQRAARERAARGERGVESARRKAEQAVRSGLQNVDNAVSAGTHAAESAVSTAVDRSEDWVGGVVGGFESGVQNRLDRAEQKSGGFVDGIRDRGNDLLEEVKDYLPDWFDDAPQSVEDKALMEELRAGVKNPSLLDIMLRAGQSRFYVMRAECTLPLQVASYLYPTHKDYEEQDEEDAQNAEQPTAELSP